MKMHVHRWGEGPPILLVHGGILGGRHAWRAQRELASRWALLAVDRPGHGETPLEGVQDYRRDAELLEQVIEDPVHAVGLSYGCFGLMLAAAARQEMIRSLTVIEPPFPAIAADVPEVQRWEARLRALGAGDRDDIVEALREFYEIFGVRYPVPDPLPAPLAQGVTALRGARLPDHPAALPLAALSAADFPKLVVSGGHLEVQEAICDRLAAKLGAQRKVVPGVGHTVPDAGEPFNEALEAFWLPAEDSPSAP